MPAGRPSKYKPEFCDLLIEHMERGGSYEGFAGHPKVRVSIATIYTWEQEHPEFLEAKGCAFAAARNHWDEIGSTNVHSPPGQWSQNTWMFIQRTRFAQRDGMENSNKEVRIITPGQDSEKLENLAKQLAALIAKDAKHAKTEPSDASGDDNNRAEKHSQADGPDSTNDEKEK